MKPKLLVLLVVLLSGCAHAPRGMLRSCQAQKVLPGIRS